MRCSLFFYGFFYLFSLSAQNDSIPSASQYDFWVGNWEVSWDEGEGKRGRGTNLIRKILDNKVIEENFEILQGQSAGFKGKSISVYNPRTNVWKQAWADNQGGYFDFTGVQDGNKRYFQTANRFLPNGNQLQQRMVFYDIDHDHFTWDWESSNDGGQTWSLQWRINYQRKE